jgi:hypothetical protein
MKISELIGHLKEIESNFGDVHLFIENIENNDFIRDRDFEHAELTNVSYAKNMYPTALINDCKYRCVDGVSLSFSSFYRREDYIKDR